MNWFTRKIFANCNEEEKKKQIDNWGGCEHVEKDSKKLFAVSYENDSFGREGYCLCEDCYDKLKEEEKEEKHFCVDCKSSFPLKEGFLWKWYDFYAESGDIPLAICKECGCKEKHINRVKKDFEDYKGEFYDADY